MGAGNSGSNCWLLVDGVNKPKLWFYLPVDYWHNVEPLPKRPSWTEEIEVVALPKADENRQPATYCRAWQYRLYRPGSQARLVDIAASSINPKGVIDYLHYYRAYKTDYELVQHARS